VTRNGQIKRSPIEDYAGATRKGGIRGVGLDEGDSLIGAFAIRNGDHLVLVSNSGMAIRFELDTIRTIGRSGGGVRGMKLDAGEFLCGAAVIPGGSAPDLYLLCAGENGVGKRTSVADFPVQGRAGQGVIAFKASAKTGQLVAAMGVTPELDLIMFASNGVSNRISVPDIRETGRSASGVILMDLDAGHKLVSVTTTPRNEEPEFEGAANEVAAA
jgi:DNA gyrase subunit A